MKRRLATTLLLGALAATCLAAPASAQLRYVGDRGVATVGVVSCPGSPCQLAAPKRVKVEVGERSFWARVMAPKRIAAGARAKVRVRLGARALAHLAGRTTTIRVRAVIRQGEGERTKLLRIRLRRAALTGAGGGSNPASGPLGPEPPLLARPATALDVSAAQVTWYPRDSWIRYVSSGSGAGDGILFAGGAAGAASTASACPDRPSGSDALLPYAVGFAAKPSWYDPVSGSAAVYGQGSVSFRWQGHGIDLTATDPEIEINGAASRAIFRFKGSGGTAYPDQRAVLLSLDPSGQPAVTDGGKTFTYSLMRGTLTADGVNVFAGFYAPPDNDEFGCVSVAFTTP